MGISEWFFLFSGMALDLVLNQVHMLESLIVLFSLLGCWKRDGGA